MTIQDLEAKVKASEEKLVKIQATIEKAKKRLAKKVDSLNKLFEENGIKITYDNIKGTNWVASHRDESYFDEMYDLYYDIDTIEESIQSNTSKLKDAERVLNNWKEKLRNEQVKLQYIQDSIPQEIKDFLLDWKNDIMKIMQEMAESFVIDRDEYYRELNKIYYDYMYEHRDEFYRVDPEYDPEKNYYSSVSSYKVQQEIKRLPRHIHVTDKFERKYSDPLFRMYKSRRFDNEWLEIELTREMNDKLVALMQKVSKITGVIKNADLYINKGDLNGIVYGEDGNAQVTTIGAGGYAIQRYHLRVLVKEVKKE